MDVNTMIERIQKHPDSNKIGMIASHLGVVRGSSLNGRNVTQIDVSYDHDVIENIIKDIKVLPGIVEVLIELNEGLLAVGDEIMFIAVGGDIRDNVFPALIKMVDRVKKEASRKREFFE